MFSYYYVATYNIHHKTIKGLLGRMGLTSIQYSMFNLQIRSQMYMDFETACEAVHQDFELKMPPMYGDNHDQQLIRMVTATNPMFNPSSEDASDLDWSDDCAGSVFYAEAETEEMNVVVEPNSWLIKYEIYFIQDITEWSRNGDATFSPPDQDYLELSSTYH